MEEKKTILIVDDNDEIVELVKCMLSLEGYETIDGCSGEDALYLNERYPFSIHLLLTDIRMSPNMNGCDLAHAMRIVRPGIKVIYMSAFTDDNRVGEEVSAGQAYFLRKPFTKKDLLKHVEAILEAQAPVRF
ncbi:MAG: sensory box histidine kinase/response regulator [Fibrobacteres bacterium]|nr:sensory box histidine kinase/response regulator [Fibrobacterota bacterium]